MPTGRTGGFYHLLLISWANFFLPQVKRQSRRDRDPEPIADVVPARFSVMACCSLDFFSIGARDVVVEGLGAAIPLPPGFSVPGAGSRHRLPPIPSKIFRSKTTTSISSQISTALGLPVISFSIFIN
ncbi:hypothetical protein JTB14_028285 [Gonioctena quinquepunctata]|nr:hypothetical protein JTB14_028285 [Gonioctena quinquepunctata]